MLRRYGPSVTVLCGGLLAAFTACAAALRPGPSHDFPPTADFPDLEGQVFRLVNAHRKDRGLRPLRYDTLVAAIARAHSREMAEGRVPLGHEGLDERGKAIEQREPFARLAENVALNDYPRERTVRVALRGWLASAHHLANIEGPYSVTGVGVAQAPDGTFYYTQIFVAPR
jgi:uncharacterized protein YkwD